jgi:UDP-glucose 4-epimerase
LSINKAAMAMAWKVPLTSGSADKAKSFGNVLVTGGAGYIGATVCSALLDAGWTPIILDNLCQGRKEFTEGRIFYQGDIADRSLLKNIIQKHGPLFGAIHCAALIVVPESVTSPEEYYRENVSKSVDLFAGLRDVGCQRIVFSSSAAIYDVVDGFMVTETSPLKPSSPYARTKFMMEMVLRDFCEAYGLRGIALRYFNPIGADPKMRTGAYVKSPTHVLGRMVSVSLGKEPTFEITGTNWPTRDGSGIRDYIHVWDLARAHVKAIENFDQAFSKNSDQSSKKDSYMVMNLGTGRGVTVRELVSAFEKVNGRPINKKEAGPRPGDVAGSFASCALAASHIGWSSELSIEQGISDALNWAKTWDDRRQG